MLSLKLEYVMLMSISLHLSLSRPNLAVTPNEGVNDLEL